jgi:hypothetical protein
MINENLKQPLPMKPAIPEKPPLLFSSSLLTALEQTAQILIFHKIF